MLQTDTDAHTLGMYHLCPSWCFDHINTTAVNYNFDWENQSDIGQTIQITNIKLELNNNNGTVDSKSYELWNRNDAWSKQLTMKQDTNLTINVLQASTERWRVQGSRAYLCQNGVGSTNAILTLVISCAAKSRWRLFCKWEWNFCLVQKRVDINTKACIIMLVLLDIWN